ncbi:hypothetical protein F4777DRAFT_600850 [Nemania sp. FL0916]|nr:hypothetical protein F4777DRAFT_600850 [Nemania sp. FL0916]
MARRKIVADSEDEDDCDDISRAGSPSDPPELEPLSPPGRQSSQQSHTQAPDIARSSFFANIYEAQQSLAEQQSRLIENIVRQSQRASGSSGDASLSGTKKGTKANVSSGTDVTSPMVLSRARIRIKPASGDASEITTPRKSIGQEWDIPSSPEVGTSSQNPGGLNSKDKTKGQNQRKRSRHLSSPVATETHAVEQTVQPALPRENDVDDQFCGHLEADSRLMPAAKKAKISHHDHTLTDTTQFYVAQSNLTTMQKLEYQKVNVSMNGNGGLSGYLPNQKSSGATTIAYPTPKGYSSGPLLPGEESLAQPASPERHQIINISSSPDVIGSALDLHDGEGHGAGSETGSPVSDHEQSLKSPRRSQTQPSTHKKKRKAPQTTEEDELGQDDAWNPDQVDKLPELYKPRPRPTKRRSAAAKLSYVEENVDAGEDDPEEPEARPRASREPVAPALLDTDPPEPPPETPVKKRGRKRKKPDVVETVLEETEANDGPHLNQELASPPKETPADPPLRKEKKRRGRPRKSGNEQKGKRKANEPAEEDENEEPEDHKLPLKEVDRNTRSPSKSATSGIPHAKTSEEPDGEKPTLKTQLKETPKGADSLSKIKYRVGLSKRSRIAPLLKTIKK